MEVEVKAPVEAPLCDTDHRPCRCLYIPDSDVRRPDPTSYLRNACNIAATKFCRQYNCSVGKRVVPDYFCPVRLCSCVEWRWGGQNMYFCVLIV